MAITLNNGANLPDIPEGVLDERPYAVVCQSIADPTTYTLMVSSWEVFCVPASITGYTCIAPWADQMNYWYHQGTDSDWNSPEYTKPLAAAEYTIVWANHDVYTAAALESNTLIPGDIYFAKSEPPKGIVIDGIELPFPTDVDYDYKYKVIAKVVSTLGDGTPLFTQFQYLGSNCELSSLNSSLVTDGEALPYELHMIAASDFSGEMYSCMITEQGITEWGDHSYGGMVMDGIYDLSSFNTIQHWTLEWSNCDIKLATALNEETGEITVGNEIYWYAGYASDQPTSSLPPYLCESSDWYKAVANEIRRISKSHSSFEFDKNSIEKALYGGVITPKSIIEGSYTKIIVPETVNVNNPYIFDGCDMLQFVDLGKANQIHVRTLFAYGNNGKLDTLILRSDTVVTVNGITGTSWTDYPLYGTQIEDGKGYIYVPSALVDSYKNDSVNHWSEYADQFRAIEDYPDICG